MTKLIKKSVGMEKYYYQNEYSYISEKLDGLINDTKNDVKAFIFKKDQTELQQGIIYLRKASKIFYNLCKRLAESEEIFHD